jgi:2-polyprenyl-3-methyl-5-hydroxy-6-metoxy-1,4-benzoquinol methylase
VPTSDNEGKAWTKDKVEAFGPRYVIDVGPGEGTYSDLLRKPGTHWTGIEAFEPYVDQFDLRSKYDYVVVEDVREHEFSPTDLIILGDVLEHMTQREAKAVIRKAKKAARAIVVSIPIVHLDQDAVNGNEFERHVEHWTYAQMNAYLKPKDSFKGEVLAAFWWEK